MFVDDKKAYTYFRNRFAMRKATNGFFAFDCPFCINGAGNKKHAVSFTWGICKCWVCGYKDYIPNFIKAYEGVSYTEAKAIIENEQPTAVDLDVYDKVAVEKRVQNIALPFGFKSLMEGDGVLAVRARNYLKGRGFDIEQLDAMGFGYCNEHAPKKDDDYFGYIIVPFKRRGELYYFLGRDYTGNFLRYKNPPTESFGIGKGDILFNEDALELSSVNYITEGWTDAMTMGKGGIASLGWALSPTQKSKLFSSDVRRFVFLPDTGRAQAYGPTFYQEAVKLALSFIDHKECVVVDLTKATNGKDVNEIGKDVITQLIRETPLLTEGLAMDILTA